MDFVCSPFEKFRMSNEGIFLAFRSEIIKNLNPFFGLFY